ncbi:alpha/beta hydrolase fold-3 domain-containing protein [Biscogniauxia mediterranea]|nr:alpha/beta hydrolase fold-3 domain-containing protein [Biscogniauxia mediterranea]
MALFKPATPRRPLMSYPPLNWICTAYTMSSIIVHLPLWILSFVLVPAWRLHPEWSLKRTLLVRIGRRLLDWVGKVEAPVPLSLEPGKEKDQFVTIDPASAEHYQGPLKSHAVAPATIGGTWYPKRPGNLKSWGSHESVILHLHGGAFIMGDGRIDMAGYCASLLLQHAGATAVFMPQYRLASRPGMDPFPAAVQDCLTSYLHLTQAEGIPARSITVSGDSAGGNLAIALVRYLAELGPALGIAPPQSACLFSPWTNPKKSLLPASHLTSDPHHDTDILAHSILQWGAREYARLVPASDPYITPQDHPFATPVPLLVNMGATELFVDDGAEWARAMAGVEGNVVVLNIEAGAPHDTLLLGSMLGCQESAERTAALVGAFIKKHQE